MIMHWFLEAPMLIYLRNSVRGGFPYWAITTTQGRMNIANARDYRIMRALMDMPGPPASRLVAFEVARKFEKACRFEGKP